MAKDIVIAGATFNAVPSIDIPTAQGGTAKFVDPSPTTAGAADVASGKLFFDALGALVQGTASGGGGGGLEVETGTFEPTENIARPTISFKNQHSEAPIFIMMVDLTDAVAQTTQTNLGFYYMDWWRVFGKAFQASSTINYYGKAHYSIRTSSATSITTNAFDFQYDSDYTGDSRVTMPRHWATSESFRPYSNSTTRYWRAGRTYKWIAVWKPST